MIRRKFAMAVRVRNFVRAYPSDDPTWSKLVAALEERITRADALAIQQRDGTLEQNGSVARRLELRRAIQRLLGQLVRAGELAAAQRPDLAGFFQLPKPNGPHKSFFTAAQALMSRATEIKDLLGEFGMSGVMFDELGKKLAEFKKVTEAVHEGKRAHVGATADLRVVADEIQGLVALLDGMIRFRFNGNSEVLAAWDSASDVVGPFRSGPDEPPESTPPGLSDGGAVAA